MTSLRPAFVILILVATPLLSQRDLPSSLQEKIAQYENLVKVLAKYATDLHSDRVRQVANCQCSQSDCILEIPEDLCTDKLGVSQECPSNAIG